MYSFVPVSRGEDSYLRELSHREAQSVSYRIIVKIAAKILTGESRRLDLAGL